MISLIDEELKRHQGKKCILTVGKSQFRILKLMTNNIEYDHEKESHTYKGHQLIRVLEKSFLTVEPA